MSPTAAGSVPSWAPFCLFGVCSVSIRNAERLAGYGSEVFICAEVDGQRGKESGGTINVDIETILETVVSYVFTYIQSDTHAQTQVHAHIPRIHKSVIKKVGCGTSHIYTKYKNLQCKYCKYFTITVWYIICTHKQFIYRIKAGWI